MISFTKISFPLSHEAMEYKVAKINMKLTFILKVIFLATAKRGPYRLPIDLQLICLTGSNTGTPLCRDAVHLNAI